MEKQYIGARYVPIIDGEWNANKKYDALTIVTYFNNSYTSKKPVPIGVLPTDENYWALTGNYNAQVEEYRQETENVKTELDNVGKRVEFFERKNIRIIGDSYGTTNGSGEMEIIPYPAYLKNYLRLDDEHYKTAHQNGAGFGNGRFLTLLNSFDDDDTVTDLYVFGGWNDVDSRYTIDVVHANMEAFSVQARLKFPNAKLHLGMLAYAYSISQENLYSLTELDRYTYGQCSRHGFDVYEATTGVCVSQSAGRWVNTTTVQGMSHPSTEGSIYIAIALCNLINGGNVAIDYTTTSSDVTPTEPFTTVNHAKIASINNGSIVSKWFVDNEIIILCENGVGATINGVFGQEPTELGSYGTIGSEGLGEGSTFFGVMRYKTVESTSGWLQTYVKITYRGKKLLINALGDTVLNLTEAYIRTLGTCTHSPLRA